jgi:integrase
MRTPRGHIRRRGSRYEIAVPVGRDPITKRYRYSYDSASTEEEAERRRAALIEQITKGRVPQARATVSDLIDRWLSVAELELITAVNYESYIERVIRPVLGGLQLREIQDRVEVLDELYAQLRRCRRLCGGRRGLVDHRPVGQGRRRPDGEPDHQCDERCVPHRCQAASASAIHQIHAILHRAFAVAVKWRWMDRNPADLATRPRAARDDRDPPTPQDAVRLLEAAEAYRPDLALWLWLLLVTGTRRGELCAIRWSDIDFAEHDLLIERAYAVRGGQKVIKPTKTHQRRRLALDPATVDLLAEYREFCRKRAAQVGGMLAADGYVFSSDGFGERPWPPDTVTHWFRRVSSAAGVDCTLRSLRHYNATQMLAAGIDLRTAAGRLGHAAGGAMTLKVYAHRTRPADQRAAELLARELRARRSGRI